MAMEAPLFFRLAELTAPFTGSGVVSTSDASDKETVSVPEAAAPPEPAAAETADFASFCSASAEIWQADASSRRKYSRNGRIEML